MQAFGGEIFTNLINIIINLCLVLSGLTTYRHKASASFWVTAPCVGSAHGMGLLGEMLVVLI
jgi:hypothetical protein